MSKKKLKFFNRKIAAAVALTFLGAGMLAVNFGKNLPLIIPAYKVVRIIDGDTFETKEKQWIRISAIDAPEKGYCGYEEAKKGLTKLILNKDVYFKIVYHDSTRQMAIVYYKGGLVAKNMLEHGLAEYNDRENLKITELAQATKDAQNKKLGLFGSPCTQWQNPSNKACNIKGNVTTNNVPIYHLPDCRSYKITTVQLYHGDKWFCTEQEAQIAGFRKSENCAK